jgi:hypothetical protein
VTDKPTLTQRVAEESMPFSEFFAILVAIAAAAWSAGRLGSSPGHVCGVAVRP